jgi:hypothetical protein
MSKQPASYNSLEKIKIAYRASAKIVALYGDRYLPLFERMHEELKKVEAAFDLKTLAINISSSED